MTRLPGSRTRFRLARAYGVTARVLASYLWLRIWRPLIPAAAYERALVARHRANARRVERAILELNEARRILTTKGV